MHRHIRRRHTALGAAVAVAALIGVGCAPEAPPTSTVPTTTPGPVCATYTGAPATASLTTSTSTVGGTVRLTGSNWLHPTNGGSTIAVKIDEGAFSRLAGDLVHPNATVWQIVEVDCSGQLDVLIQLPTSANSSPAFAPGAHSLRLLTGSIKAGDAARTVGPLDVTVS